MRTSSIRAGDIVYASKRGRLFHAKVLQSDAAGTLLVEPIERNISYRHLHASEIPSTGHAALRRALVPANPTTSYRSRSECAPGLTPTRAQCSGACHPAGIRHLGDRDHALSASSGGPVGCA